VSRPGNGGLNLGLGDGFLGVYKLSNPGTVNHICIGVDNYDPDAMAAKCKQMGIAATVSRDPNSRTSGGDQLYIQAFDNHRLQVGPHGYQDLTRVFEERGHRRDPPSPGLAPPYNPPTMRVFHLPIGAPFRRCSPC
jgi:hypothetical protein